MTVTRTHPPLDPELDLAAAEKRQGSRVESVCAEIQRYSFLFALGTIPVRGASGLPVDPLAIF